VLAAGDVRVSAATRAIVISPHPDDGVLGAGGLIQRIVSRHGSVEVVEITSGDAFPKGVKAVRRVDIPTAEAYRWYGTVREREVFRAMTQLGVARSRVRLLGFPDEGLCQLAGDRGSDAVFASPYTRRDSPPSQEQLLAGAKYRGADARRELEELLVAFRPNLLVIPDSHDEHPDHCATHLLVHSAIDAAVRRGIRPPTVLHYLIHYRTWPADPTRFPPQVRFRQLKLSDAERSGKRRAVQAYRTQIKVMPEFLAGFDGPEERFVTGDDEVPAACWCGGINIAPPPANGR
jgi:LmbE family N-acetylglucosaminyl deacetylase